MAKTKQPANPFYVLVVLVGVAFAVTACAYGTMAYRAIGPGVAGQPDASGLMTFVDRYGVQLLAIELAALGAATCGAMGLDRLRSRQAQDAESPDTTLQNDVQSSRRIS